MGVLRIDEKWAVEYDPKENDRPLRWLRYGEDANPWNENNAVTALFYAWLGAQDTPSEQEAPEPNAAAPEAMREEFINIMVAKCGGKIMRPKAGEVVDAILLKQMQFYEAMADPELTMPVEEQMAIVSDMMGLGNAVISQGAAMVEHMLPDQREKWVSTVTRYREALTKMAEMFS